MGDVQSLSGDPAEVANDVAPVNQDEMEPEPIDSLPKKHKKRMKDNCDDDYGSSRGGIDSSVQPTVIDVGSMFMKVGFGGDDAPRAVARNLVGRLRTCPEIMKGLSQKEVLVSDDVMSRVNIWDVNVLKPIQHGLVTKWHDLEKMFHHVFYNELRVTPEEHPCLITESAYNPNNNREKLTEILFEVFNVPAFYLGKRPVFSCFSTGRTVALMAGIGATSSTCCAVYENSVLQTSIKRTNLGGDDIDKYVSTMLNEKGIEMKKKFNNLELEVTREIKEKCGYIALDYDEELKKSSQEIQKEYSLPDDKKINISTERYQAPEIIFKPSLIGNKSVTNVGFHELILQSIQGSDVDIRREISQNIVLWGGTTMFDGIVERLSNEIQKISPGHLEMKINTPSAGERSFCSWIGASIMSSLSSFSDQWITKDEFDDAGKSIVLRKCF